MNVGQIQVRLSLSDPLYDFLRSKSARLGVPVTQVIKHMIMREAEGEKFPVYPASAAAEEKYKNAKAGLSEFVETKDINSFMNSL